MFKFKGFTGSKGNKRSIQNAQARLRAEQKQQNYDQPIIEKLPTPKNLPKKEVSNFWSVFDWF
jgi:hypothetical protein